MVRTETIAAIATALAKAQGELQNAKINKTNPHFKNKYADLASVRDAISQVLSKHEIAVTQTMMVNENSFILVTTLMHKSGEWISSEYPLPMNAKPQELGSALTYARRYSLTAMVGISADEDDDAEIAREKNQTNSSKVKPSAVAPQTFEPVGTVPQLIPVPMLDDSNMKPDWIKWGGVYLASLKTATTKSEADTWSVLNASPLDTIKEDLPKVYQRITDNAFQHYNALKE